MQKMQEETGLSRRYRFHPVRVVYRWVIRRHDVKRVFDWNDALMSERQGNSRDDALRSTTPWRSENSNKKKCS